MTVLILVINKIIVAVIPRALLHRPAPWWIELKVNLNQLIDLVLIHRRFSGRAEFVLEYFTLIFAPSS